MSFPAIVGTFGLFVPEGVAFSDMSVSNVPFLFRSERPVPGYVYISAQHAASGYEKAAFLIDEAPRDFRDFYIHTPVPELCDSCRGKGCRTCNELGYLFSKKLKGMYSSEELQNITRGIRSWQK